MPPDRRPEPHPAGAERRRRQRRARTRRGLALLGAVAAACALVFFLDAIQRELAEGPELFVTGPTSGALVPGADVWVAGRQAGRVLAVRFRDPGAGAEDRVVVRIVLHEDAARVVGRDATVRIHPSSLLAPTVVAIEPGPPESPRLTYPDTLSVTETVTPEDLERRLAALRDEIRAMTAAAEAVGRLAEAGDGTLARLRRDAGLRRRLAAGLASLRRGVTAAAGSRELSRLLEAGAAATADARAAAERLGGLAPHLERRADEARRLAARTESLERRLDALGRRFARADGTAARLARDHALRSQIALLRQRLDELPAALLADPLAWLRLRLF